jgi:cysteine synthase B
MGAGAVIFSYNKRTSIKVQIMSNITPDFQADDFLLDHYVGKTPLVRLQRLACHTQATVLAKLEGNNPAGSVKDRPAYNMIMQAEKRGQIKPGDTLIEATSGNTGIALAMVAAMRGYKMKLIMPANSSQERKDAMRAYGAELIESASMEEARDMAAQMQADGIGLVLNQFGNPDNSEAHYLTTGPEIWEQTGGKITHFVSAMGTTGTIMGISKYLKEQNPDIQIVGLQPSEGSNIAGIRRWPKEYLPTIFDASRVDRIMDIPQIEAEKTARKMAREEGISAGTSSGGAVWASVKLAEENPDAVIVCIICDRGDRYLSTGLFSVVDAE